MPQTKSVKPTSMKTTPSAPGPVPAAAPSPDTQPPAAEVEQQPEDSSPELKSATCSFCGTRQSSGSGDQIQNWIGEHFIQYHAAEYMALHEISQRFLGLMIVSYFETEPPYDESPDCEELTNQLIEVLEGSRDPLGADEA